MANALLVHHVVIFEQMFADGEVLPFDLLLSTLDGVRDHLVLDGNTLLHAEPLHQTADAIAPENTHQVVFEGQEKARASRIALTSGAAAELVVDAP